MYPEPRTRRNAWKLLHAGLAHVVASDAHRASGNRICKLSDAYKLVVDEIGEKECQGSDSMKIRFI